MAFEIDGDGARAAMKHGFLGRRFRHRRYPDQIAFADGDAALFQSRRKPRAPRRIDRPARAVFIEDRPRQEKRARGESRIEAASDAETDEPHRPLGEKTPRRHPGARRIAADGHDHESRPAYDPRLGRKAGDRCRGHHMP